MAPAIKGNGEAKGYPHLPKNDLKCKLHNAHILGWEIIVAAQQHTVVTE